MYTKFQKRLVLVIGFCLCVMLGSGVGTAMAGQDAGTMLENWFNGKRSAAVSEIDLAITSEKERLMGELRLKLNESIGAADAELTSFTEAEKSRRVQALRDYAASLMAGIGNGNADWDKASYLADVDKAVNKAIQEINKAAEKAKKDAEKKKGKPAVETPAAVTEPEKQEAPAESKPSEQQEAPAPEKTDPPAAAPAPEAPPESPEAVPPSQGQPATPSAEESADATAGAPE
ncbi:hypothetical protein [Bhargavaea cecembensis]|uniref:hypothetical protein n=1 Tax=Bhargavaea cecembensis TaxID=394098 RepID=UPI00058CECFA|nr:hypothetical protein [Bhargavaea cecembensis]